MIYRIYALFSLLCITPFLFTATAQAQPQATPVGVDAVQVVPMRQTVPILGRFVARQSGVIAARSPGPVARLLVHVGDTVQQGDVLAELDRSRLSAALALQDSQMAELRAYLKTVQATAKLAAQELERIKKLQSTAAFTRFDYDQRVQQLAVAQANVEEAQARIVRGEVARDLAQLELDDSNIIAPYAGIVSQRHASAGVWLQIGDPVVTLINNAALEIEAEIPAKRIAGLQDGTQVDVILDTVDGQNFSATLRAVIPDEDPTARTRPARFTPDAELSQQLLAINQDVTLQIPASAAQQVLSVAKDAVLRNGAQALVYLVSEGKAQMRPVQLGEAVGDRFQVVDGLNESDIVVVRGNERLHPGQAVTYPGMPQADLSQDLDSSKPAS